MGEIAPPGTLRRLDFLIGTFTGEGSLAGGRIRVEKRTHGAWEVGGHFLALRMVASYWVGKRLADRHEAMVLVGAGEGGLPLLAAAYTDSGARLAYELAVDGDGLVFEDRPPHGSKAARAWKTITPTADGYRERLELEARDGALETHVTLDMRRQPFQNST